MCRNSNDIINSDMENPKFCLTEVVSSDNKEHLGTLLKTDAKGYSLSPPASGDDKGAPNTGCSTAEGSVFTFNSVTDDSSEGKKSDPSSPAILESDAASPLKATKEIPIDKKSCIQMTIRKEYTFTIKYDYETLLKKAKEINEREEAEKKNQSKIIESESEEKRLKNLTISETSSDASPCLEGTPTSKGKFSARMFKNIFSIVTSPLAERRAMKGFIYNRHYKKHKSTNSSSSTGHQAKAGTSDGQRKQTASA